MGASRAQGRGYSIKPYRARYQNLGVVPPVDTLTRHQIVFDPPPETQIETPTQVVIAPYPILFRWECKIGGDTLKETDITLLMYLSRL
ncbi:hypothetical protein TNCV_5117321 [Trichonephila clavipes]|nr:hypothetical protein TNCV_5117321 [Trichonephila clavipes]